MGIYENGRYKTDSEIDAERQRAAEGTAEIIALSQKFPNFSKYAGITGAVVAALLAFDAGWGWFWCLLSGAVVGGLVYMFAVFAVGAGLVLLAIYILYKAIDLLGGFG